MPQSGNGVGMLAPKKPQGGHTYIHIRKYLDTDTMDNEYAAYQGTAQTVLAHAHAYTYRHAPSDRPQHTRQER